jgi:hypothetical protein
VFSVTFGAALLLASSMSVATDPRWCTEHADQELWSSVRVAFQPELEPDDPAKTAPYVANSYKYVAAIAIAGRTCLVLVGEREHEADPPGDDYFLAYSYDLNSGAKSPVSPQGFRSWRPAGWYRFSQKSPADALFTHQSCSECEAEYYLSSFFLDFTGHRWQVRLWPETGSDILIGSDDQFGDDDDWRTSCAYRIGDYSGRYVAEIAVWCEFTGIQTRKTDQTLYLYSLSGDRPERRVPSQDEAQALKAFICAKNGRDDLCRSTRVR